MEVRWVEAAMLYLTKTCLFAAILLAGCTEPNPEFEPGADTGVGCTLGTRACSGQSVMVCAPKGGVPTLQLDRACPPASTCKDGVCVPGAGACASGCSDGMVCTVFVSPASPGTLGTFCAKPVGPKPGGAPCGRDAECASGLCIFRGKGSVCFQACSKDRPCPPPLKCAEVMLTITGVQGTVTGCVPP